MKRFLVIAFVALSTQAMACARDEYMNAYGNCVLRPTPPPVYAPPVYAPPAYEPPAYYPPTISGTVCADGWVSHSQTRSGTCSHHGGIR